MGKTDVANWLVKNRPSVLLSAADWTYWPGPNATKVLHVRGCTAPKVKNRWFDQAHAVIVKTMPEGKVLCRTCAVRVLREAS